MTADATYSTSAIATALAAARRRAQRLRTTQHALYAVAFAGSTLVMIRAVVSVASPEEEGATPLATALALAWVVFAVLFSFGFRSSRRVEEAIRDIQLLELSQEDARPRVEVHPYRTKDGTDCPVVVVRSDSIERLFRGEEASAEGKRLIIPQAIAAITVVGAVVLVGSILSATSHGASHSWTFLDDAGDPESLGFRMSNDRSGAWAVEEHQTATGARALVNRAGETDAPPSTLVASAIAARDVRIATRCKVTDGAAKACGAVFRWVDQANYHVARIDLETRQLVIATVRNNEEHVLTTKPARVEAGVWQQLSVEARGDHIRVACNGRDVVEVIDPMPGRVGSGGLWAPAGAEVYFDELAVDTLAATPHSLEVLPLLRKGAS